MSITRAKSLDTLYEECKKFDLVLVPDAPLASALNRRLDRPHFGPFATTPRRLATQRRETAEDRLAFLDIINSTDLGWKETAFAVGNILQCWEYQGNAESILEYNAFATKETHKAVERITQLDTTSGHLTDYTIDADTDVAVIGLEQLTALERSILPTDYEAIDPFTDEPFDHPPFRIFDSPAAIVETVVQAVTEENASEVGVVLDSASAYSPLIESALEATDIPYYGGPGFIDDPHHRAFLELLRSGYAGSDTRIRDIRPLCTPLGIEVSVEHDEKRLCEVEHPGVKWLVEFGNQVDSKTFGEVVTEYEETTECTLEQFSEELQALGIDDELVTERAVDQLEFYLQSYEVPIDRKNEGVLLADAKSAAHVERPVVFYLGLDEGWTRSSPRRPWVDREEEFERHIRQFQLLLQNGVEQYYLVQDTAGGSPVTPCLYFEELFEESFDRFSDLNSIPHSQTTRSTTTGFEKEPVDVSTTEVETISQSSLSTYVNCPKDYFYSRLLDSPDKDYFAEGNLFHDFAEFYVAHPGAINTDSLEEIADLILEEVSPFLRDVDRSVRRTKYQIGLQTIVEYLDEHPPKESDFVTASSGWGTNFFAEHFGRTIDSEQTEQWFENTELGVKGKIDLVHGPTQLIDYKSGSKKSARSVVKDSAVAPPSDTPNFQALLYLTYYRANQPEQTLRFTFFHFLETLEDVLVGGAELADCTTTVTYHPRTYEEYISQPVIFTELQEEAAKNCQKTFSQTSYVDYETLFGEYEFPETTDSDELIDSDFGHALTARMKDCVGDYKYVTSGCKQALRHLLRIRTQNYFVDDIEAFEEFIQERLTELNERWSGDERFPLEGLGGEPNFRYVDNRDCLLEGELR